MRTRPLAPIAILFVALLVAMLPRAAGGAYAAGSAEPSRAAAWAAIHFTPAGATVSVPAIVAERLALPSRTYQCAPRRRQLPSASTAFCTLCCHAGMHSPMR